MSKKVDFYGLDGNGNDEKIGSVRLDGGRVSYEPQDDRMRRVVALPVYEIGTGRPLSPKNDPEDWIDALPGEFRSPYFRAVKSLDGGNGDDTSRGAEGPQVPQPGPSPFAGRKSLAVPRAKAMEQSPSQGGSGETKQKVRPPQAPPPEPQQAPAQAPVGDESAGTKQKVKAPQAPPSEPKAQEAKPVYHGYSQNPHNPTPPPDHMKQAVLEIINTTGQPPTKEHAAHLGIHLMDLYSTLSYLTHHDNSVKWEEGKWTVPGQPKPQPQGQPTTQPVPQEPQKPQRQRFGGEFEQIENALDKRGLHPADAVWDYNLRQEISQELGGDFHDVTYIVDRLYRKHQLTDPDNTPYIGYDSSGKGGPGKLAKPNPKLNGEGWSPDLTNGEKVALQVYTAAAGYYREINQSLIDGQPVPDEYRAVNERIQAAFAKIPVLKKPIDVYRGLKFDDSQQMLKYLSQFIGGFNNHQMVSVGGYQSSSLTEKKAQDFARGGLSQGNAVVLYIKARHGIDTEPVTEVTGEEEFLLNDNTQFRVLLIKQAYYGYAITLEQEIPKAEVENE